MTSKPQRNIVTRCTGFCFIGNGWLCLALFSTHYILRLYTQVGGRATRGAALIVDLSWTSSAPWECGLVMDLKEVWFKSKGVHYKCSEVWWKCAPPTNQGTYPTNRPFHPISPFYTTFHPIHPFLPPFGIATNIWHVGGENKINVHVSIFFSCQTYFSSSEESATVEYII